MTAARTFLCWDIDGTLLTTARAGVYALERAALEVTGQPLNLQQMATAGLTDVEITRLILSQHGSEPSENNVARFLRIYEDDLPASLHRREGRVMPGVRAVLEALRSRDGWTSLLLTGNTRRGGIAKLSHYGLAEFFADGAFSDGTANRAEIAHNMVRMITASVPQAMRSRMVVIGDTRHDIACARAAGIKCLAVATGGATLPELDAEHPDAAVEELPAPAEFIALVEAICSGA